MNRLRGPKGHIIAQYTNRNRVAMGRFRVSNNWHIEGSRLVSDVGEEIVFVGQEQEARKKRKEKQAK